MSHLSEVVARELRELRDAETAVQFVTGHPVLGLDTAAAVYAAGLKRLNQSTSGLPATAMQAAWKAATRSRNSSPMDKKLEAAMNARFPGVKELKRGM